MNEINKILFCLINFCILAKLNCECSKDEIRVFTVATEENDGYRRYIRSAKLNNIQVETLGLGTKWNGGNMMLNTGGGQKVNFLKKALKPLKNNKNMIVLFTDSYDVVFTSGSEEILKKFKKTGARILFGAEHYCWPNDNLRNDYPTVATNATRFLNSGMFIGYVSDIYEIINSPIKDTDDDQLFYTKIFLNENYRNKYQIQLDERSEIFQNLNGAKNDVRLDIDATTSEGVLHNINFHTIPNVIHGNGPSKIVLNSIANYFGTFKDKNCLICEETKILLDTNKLPDVTIALFAEKPAPFYEDYLEKILSLNYNKKNINLFIHSNIEYHDAFIQKFIENYGRQYKSYKTILSLDQINERNARLLAFEQSKLKKSNYIFVVDNDVHIDDPETLLDLLSFNRSFIAPVIAKPNDLWSNFWGALNENEFYARSNDYVDIVEGNIKGMWNVPYISSCYLIRNNVFKNIKFAATNVDPDMSLCKELRDEGTFLEIINFKKYGHLINTDDFNVKYARPDFYTLFSNPIDWEKRYIHPEYAQQLQPEFKHKQPCQDVYWFPIATEQFCDDLVAIMENYGKWSGGTNKDERLQGGYEAVPTRDIHMRQVELDPMWLKFLQLYVRPLQETVFTAYYHNPPVSTMNFVVRYKPDEQPSLRPHHDSSTYTINIALNRAGIDYTGGGCKFIRYNCSVVDTKKGWVLMHPGRLTHYHEGLRVINGTRYIMISFIDP